MGAVRLISSNYVNAIIHTHQPWATAVGFVTDELPEFLVTVIDA